MLPHVLRLGIDTLEATYQGELDDEKHGLLELGKLEAQGTGVPVPLALGGMEFFIQAKGLEGYAYRVENDLLLIRVSLTEYRPLIWARLTAYGLAMHGASKLLKLLDSALADLADVGASRLSRIDVACDVQGFEVTEEEMRHVVWKGHYRSFIEEDEGWTYQFGKRDVVVRVYNKTAQAKKKHLGYVQEVWQSHVGYDSERTVQRIEVELSGAVLQELRLPTPRSALDRIAAILSFGMEWAELRVPGADPNVSRWLPDERWLQIKESCRPTNPLKRIRRTPGVESRERALKRILSGLRRIAAEDESPDLKQTAAAVAEELDVMLEDEGRDFALLAEETRCRLGVARKPQGEEPF